MTTALQVTTPDDAPPSVALARPRLGMLRPLATPREVIDSQEATRALVQEALVEGRDYGKIPGVDKPSLLKPGAERVSLAFGCSARFRIVESEVDHDRPVPWRKVKAVWEGPKGNRRKVGEEVLHGESIGLYRYMVECEIVHRESGQVVAACIASCSTMESKYVDRPRDSENTILKMAEKRAFVGASLTAFGLSEQFTQDVEDLPREALGGAAAGDDDAVKCPKCSGPVWDNRETNDEREKAGKKRMPDYKCKDRNCEAVIWSAEEYAAELTKNEAVAGAKATPAPATAAPGDMTLDVAKRVRLMGLTSSFDGNGGKPLEEVPDKALKAAARFFGEKVREAANPRMEEQLAAIALVLADREAHSAQESLPLAGGRSVPASGGARQVAERAPVGAGATLPPRAWSPGQEPPPFDDRPIDDNDDLPF